jgi:hypothetical protein
MPEALGPAHWRARATEAQRDAEHVKDPIFKHGLLNIAMSYEAMARLAERAEDSLKKSTRLGSL